MAMSNGIHRIGRVLITTTAAVNVLHPCSWNGITGHTETHMHYYLNCSENIIVLRREHFINYIAKNREI